MKKKVLIIKNITHENPGLVSELLEQYKIRYNIIDLSQNVEFPDIEKYDLIIIMGGPDSANDKSEKILRELNYIDLASKNKIPLFGICLGLQLLAKAYSAKVYKNPIEEIGFKYNDRWFTIELTEDGKKDPIFNNIKDNFIVFQLHGETVDLNKQIKLLGTGEFCKNQIIKLSEYNYGFQFHFELTEELLNNWISLVPELKRIDTHQLIISYNRIKKDYAERGKKIFSNYLKLIHLV